MTIGFQDWSQNWELNNYLCIIYADPRSWKVALGSIPEYCSWIDPRTFTLSNPWAEGLLSSVLGSSYISNIDPKISNRFWDWFTAPVGKFLLSWEGRFDSSIYLWVKHFHLNFFVWKLIILHFLDAIASLDLGYESQWVRIISLNCQH